MAPGKKYSRPSGPKKPPLTHFLCIPLVTSSSRDALTSSLREFERRVSVPDIQTNNSSPQNRSSHSTQVTPVIPAKAIRPIGTLHCTLGVMSLNARELSSVIELLQSLDLSSMLQQAGSNCPSPKRLLPDHKQAHSRLQVDLEGIKSMHDSTNTSILYIDPKDNTDRLFPFCLALRKQFKERGFMADDQRELKLHATIVNMIYTKERRRTSRNQPERHTPNDPSRGTANMPNATTSKTQDNRSNGHGPNANAPLKVDATQILEDFSTFSWATGVTLDRISICEMGAKKSFDENGNVIDEKYTEVASIFMPS